MRACRFVVSVFFFFLASTCSSRLKTTLPSHTHSSSSSLSSHSVLFFFLTVFGACPAQSHITFSFFTAARVQLDKETTNTGAQSIVVNGRTAALSTFFFYLLCYLLLFFSRKGERCTPAANLGQPKVPTYTYIYTSNEGEKRVFSSQCMRLIKRPLLLFSLQPL